MEKRHKLAETMSTHQDVILKDWVEFQISATTLRRDLMKEGELRDESREFLNLLTQALQSGSDTGEAAWKPVKDFLGQIARSRVIQGFAPAETAMFVFSLKQPLFDIIRSTTKDAKDLASEMWEATLLLDKLGLQIMELHQQNREEVIHRQ